jgi:hypothetical protein
MTPMPKRRVSVRILDEHNLAEIARDGISAAEVVQLIGNRHLTAPNRRGEPGSILLIGETDGGRVLTIPLGPTDDPTTCGRRRRSRPRVTNRRVLRRRVR